MISLEDWNARIDAFLTDENMHVGEEIPVYRIYCQDDTDRSGGGIYNETVTADTIGRYARALGDSNPLYSDSRYAAAGIYGEIIAPPLMECCICSTFIGGKVPRLRGVSVYDAGTRWERFREIRPGDSFKAVTTFLGTEEITKQERNDRTLLRKHAVRLENQKGETVSLLTARSIIKCKLPVSDEGENGKGKTLFSNVSGTGNEKAVFSKTSAAEYEKEKFCRPAYTQEQLERVYRNLDAQLAGEFRSGAKIRYWEDVEIGEKLQEEIIGPYDESDGMSLMAAIGVSNAFATKWGTIRSRRGKGILDPETGAMRHPIDRHNSDAAARAQGLPRAIVSGIHSQAILAKSVSDWMGDAGFLRILDCRCRRPLYYGDLSIQKGTVTDKYRENGRGFVVLQMKAVRQDEVTHTEAEAIVELPCRS